MQRNVSEAFDGFMRRLDLLYSRHEADAPKEFDLRLRYWHATLSRGRAAPFAPTVCWDSISSHCTLPYGAVTFPMLMSLSGRVPHGSPDRGGPCSWLEVGMRISC